MKTNRQLHIARAFRPGVAFLALLTAVLSASAQMQLAWTRTHVADSLAGFTLDGQGNLCVAGTALGDFVTIKYAPSGSTVWSNRYDGGSVEQALAVAADAVGEV